MKPYDKNKLNSMFCDFHRKQKDTLYTLEKLTNAIKNN